jgi:hypothetical protein
LRRHGAADDTTPADRFLAALQHADRDAVQRRLERRSSSGINFLGVTG